MRGWIKSASTLRQLGLATIFEFFDNLPLARVCIK